MHLWGRPAGPDRDALEMWGLECEEDVDGPRLAGLTPETGVEQVLPIGQVHAVRTAAWPVQSVAVGEHEVRGGRECTVPVTRLGPLPESAQGMRFAVAKRNNRDTVAGEAVPHHVDGTVAHPTVAISRSKTPRTISGSPPSPARTCTLVTPASASTAVARAATSGFDSIDTTLGDESRTGAVGRRSPLRGSGNAVG